MKVGEVDADLGRDIFVAYDLDKLIHLDKEAASVNSLGNNEKKPMQ